MPGSVAAPPRIGVESPMKLHRTALLSMLSEGGRHVGVDLSADFPQAASLDAVIIDVLYPRLNLLLGRFREREIPTVVWGGYVYADDVREFLGHGAAGYVSMIGRGDELLAAIDRVQQGGTWVPELSTPENQGLSPAQERALRAYLISHSALSRAQVAQSLGLSEATLKNHIAAAREAVGVPSPSRPALRRALTARGWI